VNIKEYILSGIVESYVLGLASEQERIEFEQLCMQYPELVEARTNFELLLEKRAMENAVTPPASVKETTLSAIQQTVSASNTSKIITMEPSTTRKSSGMRWVAAASIILALAAGYFSFDIYNKNKQLEEERLALEKSKKEVESKLNSADSILNGMAGPVTLVTMKSMTPAAPSANIYWDSTSSNVFLVVKNMPKLASDKQYQLWSLLDGKPTSIGLFDGDQEKILFRMDNAKKANAFAITIEKRGNTGGPDLKQLQSMGTPSKPNL
jgi:anti-sigma-K factor RskA